MTEPVKPKTPDVWPPPPALTEEAITAKALQKIGKRSVGMMIILSIITLSVSVYIWIFQQIKVTNRMLPSRPISLGLFAVMIFTTLWSDMLLLAMTKAHPSIETTAGFFVVGLVAYVFYLTVMSTLRDQFNILVNARKGDRNFFSMLLTFFFGIVYLQYKINTLYETAEQ